MWRNPEPRICLFFSTELPGQVCRARGSQCRNVGLWLSGQSLSMVNVIRATGFVRVLRCSRPTLPLCRGTCSPNAVDIPATRAQPTNGDMVGWRGSPGGGKPTRIPSVHPPHHHRRPGRGSRSGTATGTIDVHPRPCPRPCPCPSMPIHVHACMHQACPSRRVCRRVSFGSFARCCDTKALSPPIAPSLAGCFLTLDNSVLHPSSASSLFPGFSSLPGPFFERGLASRAARAAPACLDKSRCPAIPKTTTPPSPSIMAEGAAKVPVVAEAHEVDTFRKLEAVRSWTPDLGTHGPWTKNADATVSVL